MRFGGGLLDSPHFMQLCLQSARYFCSSVRTVSAACLHSLLGSVHPASLHSCEMSLQHWWTSCFVSVALFVRISRHSSLASTHVRM